MTIAFVKQPHETMPFAGGRAAGPRAPRLAPGRVLSEIYEIRSLLGQGSMGEVYEADDRLLGRIVAIKTPALDLPPGSPSLLAEARALAAVHHPCVVDVHAVGRDGDLEYLVMERIYGTTLRAQMEQSLRAGQPLPVGQALDRIAALAEALAAVHRAGMSHRDIKPENVMLAPGGRMVLMDFGLYAAESAIHRPALVSGSPQYMAPEVIANDVAPGAGHLADLYALGVVAFELLAGSPPFSAPSIPALLDQHLRTAPPHLRSVRPDVPEPLDALIAELLSKKPAARPDHAETVAWQLHALQNRRSAPPPGATPPRILVIEDDPDTASILTLYARRALPGARLSTARSAEDALQLIAHETPDLIVLDLGLPGMNGVELCSLLRSSEATRRTGVIVVSARASEQDRKLLGRLGVTRLLHKGPDLWTNLAQALTSFVRPAAEPPRA